tara:strand:- start:435 stop:779 length:345 start_codon:yes stop_codon:yes gene_type:complete
MSKHKTIKDMLNDDKTSMMTKEARDIILEQERDIELEKERDMVNNPKHYNTGEIECIDAIDSMLTSEEFIGYLRGNSLKYRWRFRYKNGTEDLKKAEWYEKKLLELLDKIEYYR